MHTLEKTLVLKISKEKNYQSWRISRIFPIVCKDKINLLGSWLNKISYSSFFYAKPIQINSSLSTWQSSQHQKTPDTCTEGYRLWTEQVAKFFLSLARFLHARKAKTHLLSLCSKSKDFSRILHSEVPPRQNYVKKINRTRKVLQ